MTARSTRNRDAQLAAAQDALATSLINHLCALEQALRLYEFSNSAVAAVLSDIVETTRTYEKKLGEPVTFSSVEASFFICRRLVRLSFSDYRKSLQVRDLWRGVGVGELAFPTGLTLPALQEFAKHYALAVTDPEQADLLSGAWGGVVARSLQATESEFRQLERDELTVQAYCSLVVLVRHLLTSLQAGERLPMLRIKRTLQVLADCCTTHEGLLLALARRMGGRRDLALHLTNTAVYALVASRGLRLRRLELLTLLPAALFHDFPKLGLPEATAAALERPAAMSPSDREAVGARWLNAVQGLLQAIGFTEETIPRLVTIFESQLEFSRTDLYPEHQGSELTFYSQLVATASAIDSLTLPPVAGGAARAPHQALLELAERPGPHPELVSAVIQTLGWYPPGTAVLLNTGEVGLVLSANPDNPEQPQLRLVRDAKGQAVDGPTFELGADQARTVVWCLDPDRLGVNPVAAFRTSKPAG